MRLSILQSLITLGLLSSSLPSSASSTSVLVSAQDLDGGPSSTSYEPRSLFSRDDGCASVGLSSDYSSCGGGLPNNFCCNTKAGEVCHAFNDNKSVVCCPKGVDCSKFFQVGCQTQGLNVSAPGNSNSSIHSTVINSGLVTCDSGSCCPLGYECVPSDGSGGKLCQQINSTSTATGSSSSAVASLSNMPSSSPSGSSAAGSSSSNADQPREDNQCAAFPITAVLVGFFPGMILGIVATIVTVVCLGRSSRKQRELNAGISCSPMLATKASDPNRPPVVGISRKVSEPIMQDSGATRVDFLRRMSRARGGPGSPASPNGTVGSARVRSLFSGSRKGAGEDIPEVPETPQNRLKREPSSETINVFSPEHLPFAGGGNASSVGDRTTRWDDVMGGAGLGIGRGAKGLAAPPAFMGSPGMVDPRKRGFDGGTNLRGTR